MKILVTGAAGFIGFHASKTLTEAGHSVVGIDNLSAYYDVRLKKARLEQLASNPRFKFQKLDIVSKSTLQKLFKKNSFSKVLHLAAQPGVRYSLINPDVYAQTNVQGFLNILENCRYHKIKHLIYASSSSVYGLEKKMPFKLKSDTDHAVSFYGATKKANEVMAHAYWHLFGLPCTGLRFFTVYGPWMRPDLAIYSFTRNILEGKPIEVFNRGDMYRDFTYIEDVSSAIAKLIHKSPNGYKLYNIGNSRPENLLKCIHLIEKYTGRNAKINFKPKPKADILKTYADIHESTKDFQFKPKTSIERGIQNFVNWYRYYAQP